jgi:type IV pilus assembly protein PilA
MGNNQKGFTLIELLIVVAILAILAIIAGPMISSYRGRAYNAAAASDLRNLKAYMEAANLEKQHYPDF